MAQVIHEMCSYAHHLRELTGAPLHKYFLTHSMLQNHNPPAAGGPDSTHVFWLSDGTQGLQVLVHDGDERSGAWVSVSPDGDFQNASVQSTKKGRYMVRVDRRGVTRPEGRLAQKLVESFVKKHDAADVSF
ncbi:MAG: hypothetical protein B7Y80_18975 [Hyphomicrobium sp. 32-62-53]|nr:MAG: hypothetical protein B7Z29_17665 [Hyphomicrobium sp. 12-62-95]OYX97697.1 MAG: hypothetical protein B7Y80_18975 [Hyphomicrobium sp. 32-62-53]